MTAPSHTETAESSGQEPVLYGKILQQARKRKTMSVEDVAEAINVRVEVIEALESSATEGLPPAAFAQGYLRAYARHVEVSVDKVLQDFAKAVPHKTESELRARSNLPREAGSHTPLIRILTRTMLLLIVLAVLYALYSYYIDKVSHVSDNPSIDTTGEPVDIEQRASLDADGELQLEDETDISTLLPTQPEFASLAETLQASEKVVPQQPAESIGSQNTDAGTAPRIETAPDPLPPEDRILIEAEQDSWVEITDATGHNLYYNMLRAGQEREMRGIAPFDVFFGNAPAVILRINGMDVDMKRFIRSNNVARFRVSTKEDEVVFHRR